MSCMNIIVTQLLSIMTRCLSNISYFVMSSNCQRKEWIAHKFNISLFITTKHHIVKQQLKENAKH